MRPLIGRAHGACLVQVAATFKKNQEKELRDRLEREAAERERNRQLALEMRQKIEAANKAELERERQAAADLKLLKKRQYEADLAARGQGGNPRRL